MLWIGTLEIKQTKGSASFAGMLWRDNHVTSIGCMVHGNGELSRCIHREEIRSMCHALDLYTVSYAGQRRRSIKETIIMVDMLVGSNWGISSGITLSWVWEWHEVYASCLIGMSSIVEDICVKVGGRGVLRNGCAVFVCGDSQEYQWRNTADQCEMDF